MMNVDGDSRAAEAAAIQEIFARTYTVASVDGQVTVVGDAEARLTAASVAPLSASSDLSMAATQASQSCLRQAREQTARAVAELPGLNPQLRAMLLGHT